MTVAVNALHDVEDKRQIRCVLTREEEGGRGSDEHVLPSVRATPATQVRLRVCLTVSLWTVARQVGRQGILQHTSASHSEAAIWWA